MVCQEQRVLTFFSIWSLSLKSRNMASMSASLGVRAMKGRRPNFLCILCMARAGCKRMQCGVGSEQREQTSECGRDSREEGGAAADEGGQGARRWPVNSSSCHGRAGVDLGLGGNWGRSGRQTQTQTQTQKRTQLEAPLVSSNGLEHHTDASL